MCLFLCQYHTVLITYAISKSLKKKKKIIFIFWLWWVFVAAHGLSLVTVSRGCSSQQVCGLLTMMASVVAEHRL